MEHEHIAELRIDDDQLFIVLETGYTDVFDWENVVTMNPSEFGKQLLIVYAPEGKGSEKRCAIHIKDCMYIHQIMHAYHHWRH